MKCPFRVGETIYLRPIEPEDAVRTTAWVNNAEVTRTLQLWRPMTLAEELAHQERISRSRADLVLGVALVADDRLVGVAGLHQINEKDRHAVFGILIGQPTDWDKGYGTEASRLMTDLAFDTVNLNRVMLHVHEYNERAIHTYEGLGYRREGVLRQHHYWSGRHWDTIVMSMLREEWDATRQDKRTATSGD